MANFQEERCLVCEVRNAVRVALMEGYHRDSVQPLQATLLLASLNAGQRLRRFSQAGDEAQAKSRARSAADALARLFDTLLEMSEARERQEVTPEQ